jgi:hypothetical protein
VGRRKRKERWAGTRHDRGQGTGHPKGVAGLLFNLVRYRIDFFCKLDFEPGFLFEAEQPNDWFELAQLNGSMKNRSFEGELAAGGSRAQTKGVCTQVSQ